MTIIQIIEAVISTILFILIFLILIAKGKKNYKILTVIIITNLVLLMHISVGGVQKRFLAREEYKQASTQVVVDTTAPVIVLKGEKEVTLKEGEKYQEAGYSAIDDNDGSIVGKVNVTRQTISDTQYKLIYTVSDAAGNTTKTERIIKLIKEKVDTSNTNQVVSSEDKKKDEKKNTDKNSNKGIIYLTFDDGPTSTSTPKILDILKKENVKATFFILNYTESTEPLVKREIAEGHSVGIHGYSHDYKKIYRSVDTYMENLNKLQDKIYRSTGVKTTLTRFPGGSSNTISSFNPGIMTKLSKEVVSQGYRYYDWNVSSGDAGEAKNAKTVYQNVVRGLYKNGSNVVLMHDFASNDKTIGALDDIIHYGKENGYEFRAITEDTPMVKHRVAN